MDSWLYGMEFISWGVPGCNCLILLYTSFLFNLLKNSSITSLEKGTHNQCIAYWIITKGTHPETTQIKKWNLPEFQRPLAHPFPITNSLCLPQERPRSWIPSHRRVLSGFFFFFFLKYTREWMLWDVFLCVCASLAQHLAKVVHSCYWIKSELI